MSSEADWPLPDTWQWSTINQTAEVVGGATPSTIDSSNFGGTIPWITPADMSTHTEKFIARGTRNITEKGYESSGVRWLPKGAVLFSSRAPIGYVAIASRPVTTNQGFKSFVPSAGIASDYLYYWLTSAKAVAEKLASGTTFLELSGTKAGLLPIPVAPLKEQTRIVAKLEELLSDLDAGVAELKAAQRKLTQYRQSLLKAAVEGALTAEWRQQRRTPSPQPLPRPGGGASSGDYSVPLSRQEGEDKYIAAALVPLPPRGGGARGEGAQPVPTQEWLNERARQLRTEQTPHEHLLWQQLRANRFSGFKFKRQQVIGNYIVDFVCFSKRLIIELDGSQHADSKSDAGRDAWLKAQGFRVLRFWNNQMQSQLAAVLESIWNALHEQSPPLPNPSPARGEGLQNETSLRTPSPSTGEGWGEGVTHHETGAQLLERILKQRRARWEARQLTRFKEQGKAPPKDWQAKYPEPVKPDTTNLSSLPEGWVWASLDMLSEIQGGIQKQPSRAPIKNKYPFLRVANVARGLLKLDEIHEIELFDGELERLVLERGDVLIVEGNGSLTEIGRCALWDGSIENAVHQNHLIRARPIVARSEFVEAWLNSLRGIEKMTTLAATTSGLYTLSVGKISKIPVPLPPLDEQKAIVDVLELALEKTNRQEESLLISLKQSTAQRKNLLKAAFSGQLVPQDPNDEPASALLERIRLERAGTIKPSARVRSAR